MWGAVKGTGAILLREGEVQQRHGGCLWAAEGLSNGGGFKSGMTLRTELELTGRSYMRTHFSSIQVRRQAVRSWHRELAELRQQLGSSLWLQAWQPTSGERAARLRRPSRAALQVRPADFRFAPNTQILWFQLPCSAWETLEMSYLKVLYEL